MLNLIESRPGVYYIKAGHVIIQNEEIEFLKQALKTNPRGRVRICAHKDDADSTHEMIIAVAKKSYLRIHKHINKHESFHILDGIVDVVQFNQEGAIINIVRLGTRESGYPFFYRMSNDVYHTLNLHTDNLVMHEVTNGPFCQSQTIYADFSPQEDANKDEIDKFLYELKAKIALFNMKSNAK